MCSSLPRFFVIFAKHMRHCTVFSKNAFPKGLQSCGKYDKIRMLTIMFLSEEEMVMLVTVYSAGLFGIDGFPVSVEVDGQPRLPLFELVGLPDQLL